MLELQMPSLNDAGSIASIVALLLIVGGAILGFARRRAVGSLVRRLLLSLGWLMVRTSNRISSSEMKSTITNVTESPTPESERRMLDDALARVQTQLNVKEIITIPSYADLWEVVNPVLLEEGLILDHDVDDEVYDLDGLPVGVTLSTTLRLRGRSQAVSIGNAIFSYNGHTPMNDSRRDALLDALRLPPYDPPPLPSDDDDDDVDDLPW